MPAPAQDVLGDCARVGVREFCVCAGARNAALVAVLVKSPGIRIWSFPEERCAAFFALGRAMITGRPVAAVTTSGTAVAELLPAVIESHYQRLPLVLLTADRPVRYRSSGAPQAIEQNGIFGPYVQASVDCGDLPFKNDWAFSWDRECPIHVNVCLEEPGADELRAAEGIVAEHATAGTIGVTLPVPPWPHAFLEPRNGLLVMIGGLRDRERAGLIDFLVALGAPVYAEATSGLRECAALDHLLVRGGDAALARLEVTRVLRIGGVPACRFWRDLERRDDIEVFSVTNTGFPGLARDSGIGGMPDWSGIGGPSAVSTMPSVRRADHGGAAKALDAFPRSEAALVRALSSIIPDQSLVFLGNSLPIREWNSFASTDDRGLRCFANRGANGIDGAVSTFLGLGTDEPESWCVVGDLTALYDLAGPWILPALPPAKRRIVILNNGGGKIFRRLPALQQSLDAAAWRLMENPHAMNFAAWAAMWGFPHRLIRTAAELVAPDDPGTVIIEIQPDPDQTDAFWRAIG